jgi:hypothetical protein
MGWRRDEVWLDVDVLWFRERADVPGGGSLALRAAAFFAVPAPNGLSESRWRRSERRRRRQARRTRAAALVIAPAAMLTVGGQRLGDGSRGAGALEVDPPSLTLRLSGPETRAQPAGLSGGGAVAPPRASRDDEKAEPAIEWRNATSHGLPYAGSLSAGTQLPLDGPDWVTWNPVADSVPNEPHRLYGNERTIRRIISVAAAYRAANPGAPRVVVGDISFRGGGPMEAHVSHQNGLDVDVYYPRLDGRLREPRTPAQIDRRLAQDLLDRFVAAGAQMVFVGYSTGLHGARDVVIPYPSHENHLHVRFRPPGG